MKYFEVKVIKNINISIVLLASLIIVSCEKDDEVNPLSLLNKRWIQSYEEKTSEEIEVYRHGDHDDFPLSRYRQVFYFEDNNVCEYSVLAPNDAHYQLNGSWEYEEKTSVLKIFNSDSVIVHEFEVVELKTKVLKLKVSN